MSITAITDSCYHENFQKYSVLFSFQFSKLRIFPQFRIFLYLYFSRYFLLKPFILYLSNNLNIFFIKLSIFIKIKKIKTNTINWKYKTFPLFPFILPSLIKILKIHTKSITIQNCTIVKIHFDSTLYILFIKFLQFQYLYKNFLLKNTNNH